MIGCPVAWKCPVACLLGESSQQPTWPQLRQIRKCSHSLPLFRHSSQPSALGVTSRMPAMWVQPFAILCPLLVPGITNRYCSPSFETATEPVIGRAFARPVGGLLRMRSNLLKHNNLMLRSERRERLEAWAASAHRSLIVGTSAPRAAVKGQRYFLAARVLAGRSEVLGRVIAQPMSICSDRDWETCDDEARSHHF